MKAHLSSRADELFGGFIHIAHNKCLVQVAVVALQVDRHIYVDNVAILQRPLVRYPMADDLQPFSPQLEPSAGRESRLTLPQYTRSG